MAPDQQNPSVGLPDLGKTVQNLAAQFVEVFEQIGGAVESAKKILPMIFEGLSELYRQSQLIDKAGFVPHPTMPQKLIRESSGDPRRLSELLVHYYEENWPEVNDAMMAGLNRYQIDEEAKNAFREALIAHENGLYRSVVRHLFPEIERIARNELHEEALGSINVRRAFEELNSKLVLGELELTGFFGLTQLNRLKEHLYVDVNTDKSRKQMEADPVPNRHAAIHGLVVYRGAKNSLNAIFMTDYIYQVVNVAKLRLARQSSAPRRSLPDATNATHKKGNGRLEDIDLSLIKKAFSDTEVNFSEAAKLLKVHRSTLYRYVDRTPEMQRFIDDEIEHFQQVGACDARAKKAVAVNFTDVSNAEGRARRTYGPTDHRPD